MTSLPDWFLLFCLRQDTKPHGADNLSRLTSNVSPGEGGGEVCDNISVRRSRKEEVEIYESERT